MMRDQFSIRDFIMRRKLNLLIELILFNVSEKNNRDEDYKRKNLYKFKYRNKLLFLSSFLFKYRSNLLFLFLYKYFKYRILYLKHYSNFRYCNNRKYLFLRKHSRFLNKIRFYSNLFNFK